MDDGLQDYFFWLYKLVFNVNTTVFSSEIIHAMLSPKELRKTFALEGWVIEKVKF